MRASHGASSSGGSARARWFLAAVAVGVIVGQALWINSLRNTADEYAGFVDAVEAQMQNNSASSTLSALCEQHKPDALVVERREGEDSQSLASSPVDKVACERMPPRVLLVTSEQPTECSTATAQWLNGRAMRNRLHYAQRHGWKLYWNTDTVDPDYAGIKENAMWNKPMLLYKLLNSNLTSGIDWLFWIDSDAIFMDMDFSLPLDEYEQAGYNLVLWGEKRMVDGGNEGDASSDEAPSYFGLNAGVMLMRNNDWTRAFLRRILDAGDDIEGSTSVQGAVLKGMCDRKYDCRVSDQSTIVYLLYSEPDQWRNQTLLEKRFTLNGHWQEYAGHLVSGSLQLKDSIWRSDRVPFVMHFAGCQLCSGLTDKHYADWDACKEAMGQALNHVEDWALSKLGLRHANLTSLEVVHADGPPSYPEVENEDEDAGAEDDADVDGAEETHSETAASSDQEGWAAAADAEQLASLAPPKRP